MDRSSCSYLLLLYNIYYIIAKQKEGDCMCHKCDCAGKGLAAFILGAIVGAAAGVLFAPAKGETTRRKLKRWADDTYEEQKEYVLEHAEDLKDKIKERASDLKEKWSDRAEEAREKISEGKEKVVKEFNRRKDEIAAKFKKDEE